MMKIEYQAAATKGCWRRITLLITSAALIHNLFGLAKGSLGQLGPPSYWPYVWWLPPIVVASAMYPLGRKMVGSSGRPGRFINALWWTGIVLLVVLNQVIPRWPHLVQSVSLVLIGLVCYIGWRTGWGVYRHAPPEHAKYANLSIILYAVMLICALGLLTSV